MEARKAARRAATIVSHYTKATKEPHPYLKFAMCADDPDTWYILLSGFSGNEGEYAIERDDDEGNPMPLEYGEYICKMHAPREFPFKPPKFYMLTPNGLYEPGKKVCISIGEFHSDNYRPGLGMLGFATELVNGLICWRDIGVGISLLSTSVGTKKKLAASSHAYNRKYYSDILAKIDTAYATYSATWDQTKFPRESISA